MPRYPSRRVADVDSGGGFVTVKLRPFGAVCAFVSLAICAAAPSMAQDAGGQNPRIALVVGKSAYPDHPLATTANDAGLVAQTLQAAGFDVVGARDLDQNGLRGALRDFLDKAAALGPDMQAFVYLAGRGVQFDGDNYFLPVDARVARDADIPIVAIKISDFSRALAATPGRARILVLDAARAGAPAPAGSSLAGGLGLVDPEDGTLMAFNAAPGTVAPDEPGPYGVYGKTLAGALREGGVPVDDVFAQTRLQVSQQTNGAVIPWSVSKIVGPYAIFERAADAPPLAAVAAATRLASAARCGRSARIRPIRSRSSATLSTATGSTSPLIPTARSARRVRAILAARREARFWRRSVDENSPRAFWTYLRVYPTAPMPATPVAVSRCSRRRPRRRPISRRSTTTICRRRRPTSGFTTIARSSCSTIPISAGRRRRPTRSCPSGTSAGAICRRRRRPPGSDTCRRCRWRSRC